MSTTLSVQHENDNCGCCHTFGNKQKREGREAEIASSDTRLAQELNALSFEQREKIYADVHAVAEFQEETHEFVEQCIKDLDFALDMIPLRDRLAYNKAAFLKPNLAADNKFKLQFLRAEEFDARKAARRIVNYFDEKYELFGEEKLVKTLTLDDLTEEELHIFKIGYMTQLPYKDRSGRPIFFVNTSKLDFDIMTVENILRCAWYLKTTAFRDEEAQKTGLCNIMWMDASGWSPKSSELARRSSYQSHCFPGRNTSFHICYKNPQKHILVKLMVISASKGARVRTRAHFGTEVENDYTLMTFGIPSNHGLLQKAQRGEMTEELEGFIHSRRNTDKELIDHEAREESKRGFVLYPRPKDVLIGRGRPYRDLPGNSAWDQAVLSNFRRYQDSTSFEKTCIFMDIVRTIQDSGGRFLERTDDGWKILDDVAATKKTSSAFRNKARFMDKGTSHSVGTKTTASHFGMNPFSNGHATKRQRVDNIQQARK